ncbi:hypothetical protein [Terasakiella pusilla]|jgi:hypothetical protein|uniref:hypothetical protein n=1 Tax=Terasakiella pusilla TaxID=64973 RepID=UPI00056E1CDC|nr:hypothetical protein [Terasakiella pusilla]
MFAVATGNQKTFEVGIYNQEVRSCVKENDSHLDYGDQWADVHYQNIIADTEEEARSMVAERYPAERGFILESISEKS